MITWGNKAHTHTRPFKRLFVRDNHSVFTGRMPFLTPNNSVKALKAQKLQRREKLERNCHKTVLSFYCHSAQFANFQCSKIKVASTSRWPTAAAQRVRPPAVWHRHVSSCAGAPGESNVAQRPTRPYDGHRPPGLNILCVADGDGRLVTTSARTRRQRPTDSAAMTFLRQRSAAATTV